MFLTDPACHLENKPRNGRSGLYVHAQACFVFASVCVRARMQDVHDVQRAISMGDIPSGILRFCLRPVPSNFTRMFSPRPVKNVLQKRSHRANGVWRQDTQSFSRAREFENCPYRGGAPSNNSPDAPSRSLVTRTVRAFYSARGHSR